MRKCKHLETESYINVSGMKCDLGLFTKGFIEFHFIYFICSFFQFWDKVRQCMVARELQKFTVLPCKQVTDFHFAILLFYKPETQSEPWWKGGIEGANPHGSNSKKIFTPTSVKQNCEVSQTAVYRIHFIKVLKLQTFLFSCMYVLSLWCFCILPFTHSKETWCSFENTLTWKAKY